MSEPFFQIENTHAAAAGVPPKMSNNSAEKYRGYFQNRHGDQWVFVYDRGTGTAELRGGDIGWAKAIPVENGNVATTLDKDEAAWLQACWHAATHWEK